MKEKVCVFNWSGLLIVASSAVCASLLLSIDRSSMTGSEVSGLEIVRAVLSGTIAALGFFTHRKIEQRNDETEEK